MVVTEEKRIFIARPAINAEYNEQMVDKSDMLFAMCRTKCQTRKGYKRIFFLCNLTAINYWCLFKQIGGKCCLKDIIVDISRSVKARSMPYLNDLTKDKIIPYRTRKITISAPRDKCNVL